MVNLNLDSRSGTANAALAARPLMNLLNYKDYEKTCRAEQNHPNPSGQAPGISSYRSDPKSPKSGFLVLDLFASSCPALDRGADFWALFVLETAICSEKSPKIAKN